MVGNPEDRFSHNEAHLLIRLKNPFSYLLLAVQWWYLVFCCFQFVLLSDDAGPGLCRSENAYIEDNVNWN